MKKSFLLLLLCFSPFILANASMQQEAVHQFLPNGTTAPPSTEVGSELSSLPVSVRRYMANHPDKEAKANEEREPYGESLCASPAFKCVRVLPRQTWRQLWPNEHKREVMMRLNRTNVALKYRHWLVVPAQKEQLDYMQLSPLPRKMKPTGHRFVLVNLERFAFGAYDAEGHLVYWGPATGGQTWCADTNEDCRTARGKYKIYRIQGEQCESSKYPVDRSGGAPMPYCMHYYRGFAIHGSTLSGFNNRSRGCIRLFYSDAKWLNQHFVKIGTEVIVR